MTITASQLYARQTARKVRLVANTVKSLSLEAAFQQLSIMDRTASVLVMKVLRQAVANATHNHGLTPQDLVIASITVGQGATYKRFRAVSRGRAHSIQKKTCHVAVVLTEKSDTVKQSKPVEVATPVAAKKTAVKSATVQPVAPKKKADKKAKI